MGITDKTKGKKMSHCKELMSIERKYSDAQTEEERMKAYSELKNFRDTAKRSHGFFQSKKKRNRRRKTAIAREKYKQSHQDRKLKELYQKKIRQEQRLSGRRTPGFHLEYINTLNGIKERMEELRSPLVLIEKQISECGICERSWIGEWFETHIETKSRCPAGCGRKLTKLRRGFPEYDLVCTESGDRRENEETWVPGCGAYVNCKSHQNAKGTSWGTRGSHLNKDSAEARSVKQNKAYLAYGNIYAYNIVRYDQLDQSNRRQFKIQSFDQINPETDDISPTVRWNKFGDYKEIRERGSSKWEVVKKPRKKSIPRLELKKIIKMWNKGKIEDLLIMIYDDGYNSKELIKLIAHLREEGHPVKKRRMITISGKLIKV